jgi:hypothetical protein
MIATMRLGGFPERVVGAVRPVSRAPFALPSGGGMIVGGVMLANLGRR